MRKDIKNGLNPYPAYKDSGVEWLGEIPAHWEVKRLKYAAPLRVSKLNLKSEDDTYIGLENIESWTGRLLIQDQPESVESTVGQFEAGDVLFGKLRPYLAKAARPEFNGVNTSEILALRPVEYSQSYLFYSFLNKLYIHWIDMLTYGTKMPRVSPDQVVNGFTPLPPLPEQRAIAAFLDRETAKIDALVAKKERLIELLQEKRTALISHAVTKGLDPDVPLKDSGVEWLEEIPAHWEVKRLKHLATVNDEALPETTDPNMEIAYVDIGNVDSIQGITDVEELVFESAPSRARRIVRQGDVIISTVRTYLRAIAQIEATNTNLIVSTGFAVIRPRQMHGGFVAYAINSPYFVERVVSHSVGVSYPAINASELVCLDIAFPSLSEQRAIATFLDRETAQIDSLIAKVQEAIDRLKELRTALISAAVTGKIDVREAAA